MDIRVILFVLIYASSVHGYRYKNCQSSSDYPEWARCDGYNDCSNGIDELNCKQEECSSSQFWSAVDNKCVPKDYLCDGFADSSDAFDESRCTLPICTRSGCRCNDTFEYIPSTNSCQPIKLCDESFCFTGGAQHQCINIPGSYRCQCAEGYRNWDPQTCLRTSYQEPMALESTYTTIEFHGFNEMRTILYNHSGGHNCLPAAFDYNFAHNYVIWAANNFKNTSVYAGRLFKDRTSTVSGQDMVKLFTHEGHIHRFAIDWIHDNIYFIDQSQESIEVFNLANPELRHVIYNGTKKNSLAHLAVDPINGYLFWSNYDKLFSSRLDGSDLRSSKAENLGINSFVLEPEQRKLWIRSTSTNPYSFNALDYNFTQVVSIPIPTELEHTYNNMFEVFGENIIITRNDARYVKWNVHRFLKPRYLGFEARPSGSASKIVHASKQPMGRDHCLASNCDGLCLPTPSNHTCIRNPATTTPVSTTFNSIIYENYGFRKPSWLP